MAASCRPRWWAWTPRPDLAVLQVKVRYRPLPHLALGDSDAARVGDWVVAVGNPFGLGGTVTAGILSARGRQIGEGPYDDFLQIDAPINRGNSGGPLFAQDGTVIGVNTAIFSPSGGSVGIGFAIPSSIVKQVVSQLESSGKVERGYIGVSAPGRLADHGNGPAHVIAGWRAGRGSAEGQPGRSRRPAGGRRDHAGRQHACEGPAGPRPYRGGNPLGTDDTLTVRRDGQDKTLPVTIAAMQDGSGTQQASAEGDRGAKLGLALAPLDQEARQSLNLSDGQRGVVIASVKQGSPAEAAGLQAGDVLESVGNKAVTTPQQAAAALRDGTKASGSAVALRVLRDGHQAFVALGSSNNDG